MTGWSFAAEKKLLSRGYPWSSGGHAGPPLREWSHHADNLLQEADEFPQVHGLAVSVA